MSEADNPGPIRPRPTHTAAWWDSRGYEPPELCEHPVARASISFRDWLSTWFFDNARVQLDIAPDDRRRADNALGAIPGSWHTGLPWTNDNDPWPDGFYAIALVPRIHRGHLDRQLATLSRSVGGVLEREGIAYHVTSVQIGRQLHRRSTAPRGSDPQKPA